MLVTITTSTYSTLPHTVKLRVLTRNCTSIVLLRLFSDAGTSQYSGQSHYRKVVRWEVFMEQELRFGLNLGRFGNF